MARIVMKFGGTSVADLERIRRAAARVKAEVEAGNDIAVVVSAMAGVTNNLVKQVSDAASLADLREYDAVVSSGEQVTSGLMAICSSTAINRKFARPSPAMPTAFSTDECAWVEA